MRGLKSLASYSVITPPSCTGPVVPGLFLQVAVLDMDRQANANGYMAAG
jgi:hypothetical protein